MRTGYFIGGLLLTAFSVTRLIQFLPQYLEYSSSSAQIIIAQNPTLTQQCQVLQATTILSGIMIVLGVGVMIYSTFQKEPEPKTVLVTDVQEIKKPSISIFERIREEHIIAILGASVILLGYVVLLTSNFDDYAPVLVIGGAAILLYGLYKIIILGNSARAM